MYLALVTDLKVKISFLYLSALQQDNSHTYNLNNETCRGVRLKEDLIIKNAFLRYS